MNLLHGIKLIAMDLDDTLLKHDLSISDRTVSALEKATELGIIVMLASGRSPHAMFPHAKRIGIDRAHSYIICNNGSLTVTSDTGKTVSEHFLPPDVALEAFRLTVEAGLSCHIYDGQTIYVSKETRWSNQDHNLSGLTTVVPADFESIIKRGVYKLVIPGDPEFIVPVEAEFKVLLEGRATIFVSKPYFLEILPYNTGKGEALQEIAETILGITREQVMAFGDSMNDESMIRYAGHSVAMKNGRPEILKLARHITDFTNDEDGIADFIEQNIL